VPRGEPPHREGGRRVGFGCGEFVGRYFACGQYEYGGNDRSFRSQRSYGPRSPLRGTRSPPRVRVGVPPRRDRMDFANPTFELFGFEFVGGGSCIVASCIFVLDLDPPP
jgi:hypothetical protein